MTDDDMIARFRMYSERFKQASVAGEVYTDTLQYIICLRKERDEARQRVCEMHIHYSNAYRKVGSQIVQCETVQEVAKAYRWNCYGEHDDLSN